ncbi:MAG: phosphatase PAP2 family protein [Chitinophagales bacterium]|nr:phosphatase PAP2 family protein [Chitinophagales bacterium]
MLDTLQLLDKKLFTLINSSCSNSFFDLIMPIIRNRYTWVPVYLFIFYSLIKQHKSKSIYFITYLALCFAITDFTNYYILKPFFHRLRPCHNEMLYVNLVLNHCGGKWSFPSSHAANHMAISAALIYMNISKNIFIKALILDWALLVGFAQIYVGVHYPFDILVGFSYGLFIASILYLVFRRKLNYTTTTI